MEKEIEGKVRQRQPTVAPRRRGRRKDCGRMKMSWIWDISIGINLQGAGSELGLGRKILPNGKLGTV